MGTNFWALGAVVAAVQGLFLCFVLFSKKENRLPNRLLGLLLLVLSLTLTEWALWWTHLIKQVPAMNSISFGFQVLYGPLLLLFFETTFERKPLTIKKLWHFLPFALAVFFMLPFYLRFFEGLAASIQWIPLLCSWPWFPAPFFIQMIAYGVWISVHFRQYVQENDERRRWLRWLVMAYWGIVLVFLFYRLTPWVGLTAQEWDYLDAFSLTVFIYLVAWLGYVKPKVFAGTPLREAMNPVKYKKSALTAANSAQLFHRILELMEQDKLYKDSGLSLDALAEKLNVQRHHVSQAINEQSGNSFSSFVNEYRIREAKRLLADTGKQEMNAIEVAYEVGFNTKNAFNLAFKKSTGMTPSTFRQTERKKD